jgi:hypothetical protein
MRFQRFSGWLEGNLNASEGLASDHVGNFSANLSGVYGGVNKQQH